MKNIFILLAGLAGLAGVAVGAASAHGMSDMVARDLLETASRFLIAHAAALLALASYIPPNGPIGTIHDRLLTTAGIFFSIGMVLFGGGLTVHGLTGNAAFAAIVPVGGTALMIAWLTVAAYGVKMAVKSRR